MWVKVKVCTADSWLPARTTQPRFKRLRGRAAQWFKGWFSHHSASSHRQTEHSQNWTSIKHPTHIILELEIKTFAWGTALEASGHTFATKLSGVFLVIAGVDGAVGSSIYNNAEKQPVLTSPALQYPSFTYDLTLLTSGARFSSEPKIAAIFDVLVLSDIFVPIALCIQRFATQR